ncbi:major facilitator superfamily transporter [Apodospora peruviana]|uniref:Major facilitator superfamily transporter n=1 Tax=Apodospora peruviana TaxID=516989 RepID=A0AAE0M3K3_9PEZI|nr:major facilitator superfamily transporter [Apodospora peruviana]KAK3317942.1 major facilitator superfamily transporter [Apodospora peruviana]
MSRTPMQACLRTVHRRTISPTRSSEFNTPISKKPGISPIHLPPPTPFFGPRQATHQRTKFNRQTLRMADDTNEKTDSPPSVRNPSSNDESDLSPDDTSTKEDVVIPPSLTDPEDTTTTTDQTATITTDTQTTNLDLIRHVWNWMPAPARYDTRNPPKFTVWLNMLFGFAGCFTVSNLYYNQAILNKIADTFGVSFEKASSIATLMQAGYAAGMLLICPLGDLFPRRPFILALIAFTATMWIALCVTSSFTTFSAISFLCGFTTVTPQLMLPLVGDLAPAHRRASCLAIVVSGLSLGVLVARILSGVLANYTDWRNIYWFGLGVQYLVLGLLYVWLPDYPSKNPDGLNYFRMLWSIVHLFFTEPLLFQSSVVAFFLSATFTSYWTTLSFLLSTPPYSYSSVIIGLFGLIGVVVILLAPVYSRLVIDKVVPLFSAIMGLSVELVGVIIGTFIGSFNVAGPVIQAITIDVGSQFTQIGNRAAIYGIQPDARNRVNTAYMVAAFSGQLTGTAVGNRLYAQGGWVYSGSMGIAFIGFALIVCIVRGPRETGWFGWTGGWTIRRDDLPAQPSEDGLEEGRHGGVLGSGDGLNEEKREKGIR